MGRLRLSLQQVPASFGSMLKLGLSLFLAFIFVILTEASGPDINEVRKLDAQLPDHTSRVKREAAKGCKGKKCRREKQRRKIAKQEKGRDKSGKKKAAKRKTGTPACVTGTEYRETWGSASRFTTCSTPWFLAMYLGPKAPLDTAVWWLGLL